MKCDQLKCAFNSFGGCRECSVCKAKPNEINEDCDKCWNCKSDEGILRWDETNEQPQEEEEIVEVMMTK